jgi:hypothetical protein
VVLRRLLREVEEAAMTVFVDERAPKATLVCKTCGHTCRRRLQQEAGSRGHHETSTEPALCPKGHGLMVRKDGLPQENWALWAHPTYGDDRFKKEKSTP